MQPIPHFILWFQLIVWCLISIPIASGNGFLARRLDKSVVLWVILSLIPGVNVVFMYYYVGYRVIYALLDRLAAITNEMRQPHAV